MFDYNNAFSRNIGWVSAEEQQALRKSRVAIAGLGGVGGSHLLTLTRLGVGNFNIADLDKFEIVNFNRQAGAFQSTIDQEKSEVLRRMSSDINPEVGINVFSNGVTTKNLEKFLDGCDLYIDGLDFFCLDIRRAVFKRCYEKGIPAITVAPLGMGAAFLCFMPGRMSFEDYFQMEGCDTNEQLIRFIMGLSPSMLQISYLNRENVDLDGEKGPSTVMGCELCAGIAATNALKILMKRGKVLSAPSGLHFDAFRNKLRKTWRPGGNKNPINKLGINIIRNKILKK